MQLRSTIVMVSAALAILAPAAHAASGPITENSNGASLPQTRPVASSTKNASVDKRTTARTEPDACDIWVGKCLPYTHPVAHAPTRHAATEKSATRVVAPMIRLPAATGNQQDVCLLGVEDCN